MYERISRQVCYDYRGQQTHSRKPDQDRKHPTGAARSLLKIVEADPQHTLKALSA